MQLPDRARIAIGAIALSAAGYVGIIQREAYIERARPPVPGDKCTNGFGATEGVKCGDTTTPTKAVVRAYRDIQAKESAIKQCVTVPLSQNEYDAFVDTAYNIGAAAFCASTIVKKLNAGEYAEACAHIEDYVCGPATDATRARFGEKCYRADKPLMVMPGLVTRRATMRALCETP